jgi:hypothetical protein
MRTFEQIFQQAAVAGPENVLLIDPEVALVMAGGSKPVKPQTIVMRRYRGAAPAIAARGPDREALTRLSDLLAFNKRRVGKRAGR